MKRRLEFLHPDFDNINGHAISPPKKSPLSMLMEMTASGQTKTEKQGADCARQRLQPVVSPQVLPDSNCSSQLSQTLVQPVKPTLQMELPVPPPLLSVSPSSPATPLPATPLPLGPTNVNDLLLMAANSHQLNALTTAYLSLVVHSNAQALLAQNLAQRTYYNNASVPLSDQSVPLLKQSEQTAPSPPPIVCQWATHDGQVCGRKFTESSQMIQHIKLEHTY